MNIAITIIGRVAKSEATRETLELVAVKGRQLAADPRVQELLTEQKKLLIRLAVRHLQAHG